MKIIKNLYKKIISKKILALIIVALFILTVLPLATLTHPVNSNNNVSPIYSASNSSTPSTPKFSAPLNYSHNVLIANSSIVNTNAAIDENSTFSDYSICNEKTWSYGTNNLYEYKNLSLNGSPNYIYTNTSSDTLKIDSLAFIPIVCTVSASDKGIIDDASIGIVYVNVTINGYTASWSHTFNYKGNYPNTGLFVVITPEWSFSSTGTYILSDVSSGSINITVTPYNTPLFASPGLYTTTTDQGQNTITTTSISTGNLIPFAEGYHYNSAISKSRSSSAA